MPSIKRQRLSSSSLPVLRSPSKLSRYDASQDLFGGVRSVSKRPVDMRRALRDSTVDSAN